MDQKKYSDVIRCGFAVVKDYKGQDKFDEDYVDREIIQVAKKVGDGDTDFVIVDEVKETRRPIRETILAQFDSAGINAYLAPFIQTGQPLPKVEVSSKVDDFSDMPEDLAAAAEVGHNLQRIFDLMDPALKGKAKNPEEFMGNLTKEYIDNYINSKLPKAPVEEVKEEK